MNQTTEQSILFDLIKGKEPSLPEGFNPKKFILLLRRHKLLPLSEKLLTYVDKDTQAIWKTELKNWAARALLLFQELKNVVQVLEKQGIEVIVMKGPVLSYQLYGSVHARQYSDLDIIIEQKELLRAIELLESDNFILLHPGEKLDEVDWNEYLKYNNDVVLKNRNNGTILEMHMSFYVEQLIDRKDQNSFVLHTDNIYIQDFEFRTLKAEYNFLYLCFHGAKHMFFRLCWLKDIAEILSQNKLDHQKVLKVATSLGLEKMLRISLLLAEKYFKVTIPTEYKVFLSPVRASLLVGLNRIILLGPGDLVYEKYREKRRNNGLNRGIDRITFSHFCAQVLYLIGLRKGCQRKFRFLLYQFRKRK